MSNNRYLISNNPKRPTVRAHAHITVAGRSATGREIGKSKSRFTNAFFLIKRDFANTFIG